MIRITGGRWRGRSLLHVPNRGPRPSTGRLREALFSILGDRVVGARVADIFAGAGALGIEALSRGAQQVDFVEIDPITIRGLRANLEALGAETARYRIHRGDARRWITKWAQDPSAKPPPALLLLDPPYREDNLAHLLPRLGSLVESGAIDLCVVEHPTEASIPEVAAGVILDTRRYGRSAFTILERNEP